MTPDEHQRERMQFWREAWHKLGPTYGDSALIDFDARFPAPSAAAPVEAVGNKTFWAMTESEYTSLRQKSRLWDAVASGKVRIDYNLQDTYGAFYGPIGKGKRTDNMDTAEEAVEAAIAAGALK